ncbi:MAG: TonB-dependent receptor [Prevotellaceae bacterium]|nr:TonB-dependent receptor [Candidatus Minthosoma equi]
MAICLVLLPFSAFAQTTITGVVRETTGEPIPGASVREKGTTNGSATDVNGKFSFNASSAKATIVVSFVGYETQEVALAGRKNVTVTLKSDDELLDDVVVVGYGTMKKKLVTGATVQVKGEDVAKLNTTNALTAMQATTPGVNITQSSTQPGKGFKVNIRGVGTIGESSPLLIIDGVNAGTADNGLNGLNPNDIESIDVLKDAASAAIYGARAANGVILVTTKQGKAGKVSLQYDGFVGWSNPYKRPATLGAKDYMKIVNETNFNTFGTATDWSSLMNKEIYQKIMGTYVSDDNEQYTNIPNGWDGQDWFNEYRNKNAVQTSHAVSLTGGTDRSKFSMSINYSTNEGILGGSNASDYKRYGGRINSEHVLLRNEKGRDIITIGENISYWYHSSHDLAEGNGYWSIMQNAYKASPLVPAYNAKGELTSYDVDGNGIYTPNLFLNPLQGFYGGEYNSINRYRDFGVGATFFWVVEPIKGLKYRGQLNTGYSASNNRSSSVPFSESSTNNPKVYKLNNGQYQSSSIAFENTISYTFQNLGKHNVDVLVGQSIENSAWNNNLELNMSVNADEAGTLLTKGFKYMWANNFAKENVDGFKGWGDTDSSLASFFGRANWNYDEKYMATVTLRTDGSSNFAKGKRWGTFPSFSAGWDIARESFMENTSSWLDQFKIRASWGQNGNCQIDNFYYLSNIGYSPTDYADFAYKFGSSDDQTVSNTGYTPGAYTKNAANEDVTWETSEQIDLGFDARFLGGRLGLTFDWYNKKTKDWLVQAPISDVYGVVEAPYVNGGDIKNYGFEIALSWRDRIGKDFNYHANVNVATNKNKVTRLGTASGLLGDDVTSGLFQNNMPGYVSLCKVGHPVGYFSGMSYSGIWQNQAQIDAARAEGKAVLPNAVPGDCIWDDFNKDGQITTEGDCHEIGNPHPDVTLGINLGFEYKGFDFGIQAYGAFGMQVMQSYRTACLGSPYETYTTDVFGRWHGEGTSNDQPRLTIGGENNQWVSTRYMQDADFLKIQNITLGYDFKNIWKSSPFSQLRLYFQAQNLMTFTGYTGVDPEVGANGGGGNASWVRGIDQGLYPSARTFILGASIKF